MTDGWCAGNTFALLVNGEQFFPRVMDAVAAAQSEVYIETFILFDDDVGQALRRVLMETSERGVDIHVTVDGYGSDGLPPEFLAGLAESGVHVHIFDPRPRLLGVRTNIFRRLHRKIVSIDGRRAFVGGINFSADHLISFGPQAKQDYAVEIHGPLAADIHAFARDALTRRRTARVRRRPGDTRNNEAPTGDGVGRLVTRDNDRHQNDIERAYRAGVRLARSDVIIANAYFFPGYRLLRDIARAARRGVRVRLILQGQPDMPIAQFAAGMLYQYLNDAGVRVYEYCRRPLHGKVACMDDAWSTVGSSNLDPLSLALNLEANILIQDRDFTAALRHSLEGLMSQDCRAVPAPERRSGGLRRLWVAVVVFHVLRRFPTWSGSLPAHRPHMKSIVASEINGVSEVDERPHQ